MKNQNRRKFLRILGGGLSPLIIPACHREGSLNEKINLGIIGVGRQGRLLLKSFKSLKNVEIRSVCDVDQTRREYALRNAEKNTKAYENYEDVVGDKSIDAVVVATPDHWHAIITIAAVENGKDVYCEKPLTHNIYEAKLVMQSVTGNNRILQTGSMQRSMKEFRVACELVRNGHIGEVQKVYLNVGKPPKKCRLKEEKMEAGLNWNKWLGPAKTRPYHSKLSPRGITDQLARWRSYQEFGGGDVTDWGAHQLDIIHWGLGVDDSGPEQIIKAPDKESVEGAQMIYRNNVVVHHLRKGIGVHFIGSDGELQVTRGKFAFQSKGEMKAKYLDWVDGSLNFALYKSEKEYLNDKREVALYKSNHHLKDFLNSVKTRKRPIANEEVGARTSVACHLLNLSYRHYSDILWNPKTMEFSEGSGHPSWLTREYRSPWLL